MFQLLFFILLLVLIIGGIMYYLNYRNNLAKTTDYKNKRTGEIFEERSQNHITNALKEIDFLSKKYSYYLGDNSSSICYDQNKNPIEGCVCHPSCSTCGYSKNPVGMNQCLTCRNNTPNNKLYSNGAGWCGSFGPNGHKYTADSDKDKSSTNDSIFSSSVPSIENAYTQTQVDNASPGDTLLFETGIHGEIDLNDIINTECDPMVLMSQDPLNPATIYRSTISSGEALAIRRSEYIIVENLIMDGGMFGTWIEVLVVSLTTPLGSKR